MNDQKSYAVIHYNRLQTGLPRKKRERQQRLFEVARCCNTTANSLVDEVGLDTFLKAWKVNSQWAAMSLSYQWGQQIIRMSIQVCRVCMGMILTWLGAQCYRSVATLAGGTSQFKKMNKV